MIGPLCGTINLCIYVPVCVVPAWIARDVAKATTEMRAPLLIVGILVVIPASLDFYVIGTEKSDHFVLKGTYFSGYHHSNEPRA